ncbi:carboxypeptidase regulatory-like domain-containing protein [Humibacillus xanthopallidus]|uniref:carboxypeptidase regulatory-like domain-containing protein n=1 Tax=Humibacillus xanthopallidus TaxID=412689 RepID=UPI003850A115
MRRLAACVCAIALIGAVAGCTAEGSSSTTSPSPAPSGVVGPSATTTVGDPGDTAGTLTVTARYEPLCFGDPATAPPTCPTEPVAGVEVTLTSVGGDRIATATTDADGAAAFVVAPGTYVVVAGAAGGPRITPRPMRVTVAAASATTVTLRYLSSFQ